MAFCVKFQQHLLLDSTLSVAKTYISLAICQNFFSKNLITIFDVGFAGNGSLENDRDIFGLDVQINGVTLMKIVVAVTIVGEQGGKLQPTYETQSEFGHGSFEDG